MKAATHYIAEIKSTVAGIPCIIGVTEYDSVVGSYSYHAASDLDYYGYTECDWEVLDRKGYPAGWLERKMTSSDSERINNEIANFFAS
jgi:hypothetical protein